ncbi:MAG: TonB-dependent receptor [Gemmatimonadales bacterium]|nr:MAG: TonB-dependent receptor [Gemmatimonadales bacterium]
MHLVRLRSIRCCLAVTAGILALVPPGLEAQTPPPQTPPPETPPAKVAPREQPVVLPVIEVIGRSPGSILRQTGTVHILTREDMEILRPISTEDALRRLPGVNAKSEEETAIVSNIGLRGLSAGEAKSLLLEDGVPVAPGLLIGNDRYFNPRIQRVERIEVLKGSASLRYGPSTIGGVVNYLTKTPDEGMLVSARAGSFGTRELMLEAGARSGGGGAFAGVVATHGRGDGFMDKGYEMVDVMAKAGLYIGSQHTLGVKFSWYENDANISYRGLLFDEFTAGARHNPAPDDWYLTDRAAVDLNYRFEISDRATLTSVAYWSNLRRDYWRYNVDTQASNAAGRWVYTDVLTGNNRSFDRYGVDTRLNLDHGLFGLVSSAEFGVRGFYEEADDQRIRANRTQDRTGLNDRHLVDSATNIAFHVHNRIQFSDRFALTPGVRLETYDQNRRVLTSENETAGTSNTEFLPGIGSTYALDESAQLYGGVYRAFSPASNGVALDGMTDQQLEAERSTNLELGVRGTRNAFDYEFAVFRMDFQNQVVTGNSDPTLSQSNAGETLHQGAEMALGYRLIEGLALSGNVTWVPVSRFQTGANEGNRIPYSPRVLANLSLDFHHGPLRTALVAHHRGAQFGDETNLRAIPVNAAGGIWGGRMPAYTLFDLSAQWQATSSLAVFGALKNLTNERYVTGLRQGIYVGPGRNFEIGVRQAL